MMTLSLRIPQMRSSLKTCGLNNPQVFLFVGARWAGARRFACIIVACEIFNEKNAKLAKSFDSRKL